MAVQEEFDLRDWPRFKQYLQTTAQNLRDDAGFNGEWGDRGAGHLLELIETFEAGTKGLIPKSLKKHFEDFERVNDPEYAEFLRLQKKFEGKTK